MDEVRFLGRIALGETEDGEGKELLLGIVPWAPVPAGAESAKRYISLAKDRCGNEEIRSKIQGREVSGSRQAGGRYAPVEIYREFEVAGGKGVDV